jgi:hypothetical protein
MSKSKAILFTPEERSKQLDPIMREVKKQVKRYKAAKKSGKLRKREKTLLFNV